MHQWRVTKYDPSRRDATGAYDGDDWTSAEDIGTTFSARRLTVEEYLETESRYVAAALAFAEESSVSSLVVSELERGTEKRQLSAELMTMRDEGPELREGQRIEGRDLERAIRLNLRSELWCKLEDPGRFFLHFGWDFYMYVGSWFDCVRAVRFSEQQRLFVEPMESPYDAR
jgi:hypothetical protein